MNEILKQLEEYFKNTPREELEKEWREYDKYNNIGPTVNEFIEITMSNTPNSWISVDTKLPKNSEEVLIAVRNKNKPDGIWLFDLAIFYEGTGFEERRSTWENVLYWAPLKDPK